MHYSHHIEKLPWKVHATRSGTLLSKRPPGIVRRGDNIAIIAQGMDEMWLLATFAEIA